MKGLKWTLAVIVFLNLWFLALLFTQTFEYRYHNKCVIIKFAGLLKYNIEYNFYTPNKKFYTRGYVKFPLLENEVVEVQFVDVYRTHHSFIPFIKMDTPAFINRQFVTINSKK
jgi:hypothetical protein